MCWALSGFIPHQRSRKRRERGEGVNILNVRGGISTNRGILVPMPLGLEYCCDSQPTRREIIVLRALCDSSSGGGVGLTASELQSAVGKSVSKIGMGGCMKNKWAKREGDKIVATKGIDEVADVTRDLLMKLKEAGGEPAGFDPKVRRVSSFIILVMSLQSCLYINGHHQSSMIIFAVSSQTPKTDKPKTPQITMSRQSPPSRNVS